MLLPKAQSQWLYLFWYAYYFLTNTPAQIAKEKIVDRLAFSVFFFFSTHWEIRKMLMDQDFRKILRILFSIQFYKWLHLLHYEPLGVLNHYIDYAYIWFVLFSTVHCAAVKLQISPLQD